ncbi:MAG: hypothetical protein RLZZ252_1590, partial [Bacteroidota bacterium]
RFTPTVGEELANKEELMVIVAKMAKGFMVKERNANIENGRLLKIFILLEFCNLRV